MWLSLYHTDPITCLRHYSTYWVVKLPLTITAITACGITPASPIPPVPAIGVSHDAAQQYYPVATGGRLVVVPVDGRANAGKWFHMLLTDPAVQADALPDQVLPVAVDEPSSISLMVLAVIMAVVMRLASRRNRPK